MITKTVTALEGEPISGNELDPITVHVVRYLSQFRLINHNKVAVFMIVIANNILPSFQF